jgi:UDP-hydrolysing UDP-N-acetyl-D-glucosamine 2-epimerase
MVIADRFETISISIAAAYQNIPVVHVQGGEVTGSIDEKVRHANTKFADIHLVSNSKARETVIRLGEDPNYVFDTGCPSIDLAAQVMKDPSLDFNPFLKYGGVGGQPDYRSGYVVVLQHPVTTELAAAKWQIEETLNAVKEINIPAFWFAPNADAGTDSMSKALRLFRNENAIRNVHFFENMDPSDFLKLVYNAHCLVGNSSMGIRECSYMGVPVVNIGTRQNRRERGTNVIDVDYDKEEIIAAIQQSQKIKRLQPSFVYGTGNAGKKIADILATVPLRYSKILQFQNEKPMHHSGEIRIKRSSRQKHKAA